MKLSYLATAAAAFALAGGVAYAQKADMPKAPTPGSVTGDWNGSHAPSDDKQYTEKVTVPVGSPASTTAAEIPADPAPATVSATSTVGSEPAAPAAPAAAVDTSVTFTNMTVTNGPVPDTAENRSKYGQPLSRAGKRTSARGN
jgi:hypothetical protein